MVLEQRVVSIGVVNIGSTIFIETIQGPIQFRKSS